MCSKLWQSVPSSFYLPAFTAEKTIFDCLGMLDSGERSLPVWRLVLGYTCNKVWIVNGSFHDYESMVCLEMCQLEILYFLELVNFKFSEHVKSWKVVLHKSTSRHSLCVFYIKS